MAQHISSDLIGVLKGFQKVTTETWRLQERYAQRVWANSSVKNLVEQVGVRQNGPNLSDIGNQIEKSANEAIQRSSMVYEGLKALSNSLRDQQPSSYMKIEASFEAYGPQASSTAVISNKPILTLDPISVETVHNVLSEIKVKSRPKVGINEDSFAEKEEKVSPEVLPKSNQIKPRPTLVSHAKERKVPASRIGRLVSFGSLAAGLGLGTVAEVTRRSLGMNQTALVDNPFLTEANVDRIVSTMCKVRGAALKIGQLLSIQDNEVIPANLQAAFERVRQSADFMPFSQVEKVLRTELGDDWRSKFKEFDMKPFAAASIGQVHWGKLHNGDEVAVKVQYPGVARGIKSDIANLVSVLKVWNIFPPGAFIDKLVEVAEKELGWEVDYVREAECTRKFRQLVEPFKDYYVPRVYDDLCTAQVFTSELIEGVPVDKCDNLDDDTRNHICSLIMHLCLKELFIFRYMQTDPNWSNFFYNEKTKQLILLDFGATRSYDKKFMDEYIRVIKAAADGDRQKVLEMSRQMGFLTGYESKAMENAHVDTVMILGEVFSDRAGAFDFGKQNTTKRVTQLVPTILNHRLCPPPEEIYSLHRKVSGVFLLCAKLKVKVNCRSMFMDIYNKYTFDSDS